MSAASPLTLQDPHGESPPGVLHPPWHQNLESAAVSARPAKSSDLTIKKCSRTNRDRNWDINWYDQIEKWWITSLRMIPTMAFIHFLTGKSSGILSDISSGILSGILSGICSGISSGILSGKSSGILSGISSGILSDISSGILSGILSGRWGPAVPTAIWKSRLRSGSAHCDLEVAVEVRQCPLRSGSRGWGPAVPTGIWSSRWRSGCAHWDLDCEEEDEEENSSDKI